MVRATISRRSVRMGAPLPCRRLLCGHRMALVNAAGTQNQVTVLLPVVRGCNPALTHDNVRRLAMLHRPGRCVSKPRDFRRVPLLS